MNKKIKIELAVGIIVVVAIIIGGYFWMMGKSATTTTSVADGVPAPLYISQMDACRADGGQVKKETKNMGSWEALSRWECVCKNGSSFFGEHLACNQWLDPATL